MMPRYLVAGFAVVVALLTVAVSTPVRAELIYATADAFVRGSQYGDTNYGTAGQLHLKRFGTAEHSRKAWIRFDLSSLSFDHVTQLDTATLLLNFVDSTLGTESQGLTWEFRVYGLSDGHAGEMWGESSITWNNAPANNTGSAWEVTSDATLLGSFSVQGKGVGPVALSTPALADFIKASTANDVVTLILVRETLEVSGQTYVHAVAAREAGAAVGPRLELTPVPEPSALLLLTAAGLIALAVRFSRRSGRVS
jgi:hypothetical protein